MNLKLENKLQQIYNEKQNKLLPSIIKTGEVVFGIRGNYTTDATATRFQILNGYTAYVKGSKITGFMPNNGTLSYDPTTEVQNIPEGYITGGTINAVTSNIDSNIQAGNIKSGINILNIQGTFTSDANANVSDILVNKTAYVNGIKLIGTMPNNGDLSYNPTTNIQNIPAGYTSGGVINAVNSSIDNNIQAENIKTGITILNIAGNYTSDANATNEDILYSKSAYINGNKVEGIASLLKTYNSVNEMTNDSSVVANYSYGLEIRNITTYNTINNFDVNIGCNCLNIVNSFTNTATADTSLYIITTNFQIYDLDTTNSGIGINSTNAYITIIGNNNEYLLDAQYSSLDGITYNLTSLTGTCLEDNNKFYFNLCNIQTAKLKGEFISSYSNNFDSFWKPMERFSTGPYEGALYKYDGTNWNKLIDADEPISNMNFNTAYNIVNQIKGY